MLIRARQHAGISVRHHLQFVQGRRVFEDRIVQRRDIVSEYRNERALRVFVKVAVALPPRTDGLLSLSELKESDLDGPDGRGAAQHGIERRFTGDCELRTTVPEMGGRAAIAGHERRNRKGGQAPDFGGRRNGVSQIPLIPPMASE
jgi:hypothetical protein